MKKGCYNFAEAIEALKNGLIVKRAGWNGNDGFVFMQVPSVIGKDIVPKMQSLPDSVKAEFERRFNDASFQIDAIYYNDQLAIVNSSNLISSYSPSVSDALAEDWIIIE
jgi:hypothetical protein